MAHTRTHHRKANKSNKSKRKTRKTRSKRQRGSGASCSRPTENIDIDMTDEQLALNDALGTAIVRKDPSRVKQLLDEGAHATITIDDDHGTQHGLPVETIPAIMYVARHMNDSNTIILNHLLSANNNLNVEGGCAVSRMGTTLLSEAAEWMNIDMMRELLNLGADINDASHRPTALSYAVLNEDLNMINFILSDREGQINLGYTHDDARHNVIDEALELYENIESETEREIIHEIVETLKRYAVKQSIMSVDEFNTKCEKNQESGKPECGILMNELTNKTAVMPHPPMPDNTAVCFDRSALQQHLINRMENPRLRPPILTNPVTGVEISEEDIERMFPLGLDAHYTHESYTKYIDMNGGKRKSKKLKRNKKRFRKTRSKKQRGGVRNLNEELIDASSYGHLTHVKNLLDYGVDVNATDGFGNPSLYWSSFNGHTKVVAILLDYGADVNMKDEWGYTALDWASRNGHKTVVELLNRYKERLQDRKNAQDLLSELDVGNRGDGTMPYELRHEIGKYLGGKKGRKTRRNNKTRKQKVKKNRRSRKRAGAVGDDSYDEGVTDRESISQDEPFHVDDIDAIPLANEVHDLEMANLNDSFASFDLDASDESNVSFGSFGSFGSLNSTSS